MFGTLIRQSAVVVKDMFLADTGMYLCVQGSNSSFIYQQISSIWVEIVEEEENEFFTRA